MERITIEEWGPAGGLPVSLEDGLFLEVRKYVDIVDWSQDEIRIRAKNFVGVFHLNRNVILTIMPKAPTEDMFYLLNRAKGGSLLRLLSDTKPSVMIPVEMRDVDYVGFFEFIAASLVILIDNALHRGLLKKPQFVTHKGSFRGKLLTKETVRRWAQGNRHELVCASITLSKNNPENALIKLALIVLINLHNERTNESLKLMLFRSYRAFLDIQIPRTLDILEIEDSLSDRKLPETRSYYYDLLATALLIVRNSTVHIDTEGAVRVHSFVIDMDRVFESYVSQILVEAIPSLGFKVVPQMKMRLFDNIPNPKITPDIVLTKEDVPVLVVEIKYKRSIRSKDFFQLISYMERFGVQNGILVHPSFDQMSGTSVYHFQSKKIFVYKFGLTQTAKEERNFVEFIRHLLSSGKEFIND